MGILGSKETVEPNEDFESQEYSSSRETGEPNESELLESPFSKDNTYSGNTPTHEEDEEESQPKAEDESSSREKEESSSSGDTHYYSLGIMLVNGEKEDVSPHPEPEDHTNQEGNVATQTAAMPETVVSSHPEPEDHANQEGKTESQTTAIPESMTDNASPKSNEIDVTKEQIPGKSITPTKRPTLDNDITENETGDLSRTIRKLDWSIDVASGANKEKNAFKRKWSVEDEIIILEGIIKLNKDKVVGPKCNVSAESLLHSIQNALHFQPTVGQLREKLKRLKQKYKKNAGKPSQNMESHEAKLFELSGKAWSALQEFKAVGENHNARQPECSQPGRFLTGDCCSRAKELLNDGFGFLAGSSKSDFDEQMTELLLQEIEIYRKKLDVMKAHLDKVKDELQVSLSAPKKTD